jgi:hypothetical protein
MLPEGLQNGPADGIAVTVENRYAILRVGQSINDLLQRLIALPKSE